MKFRKRPVEIEAIKYVDQSSLNQMALAWGKDFIDRTDIGFTQSTEKFFIKTREGISMVNKGSWVLKGILNEYHPCSDGVFLCTYEEIKSSNPPGDML